MNDLSLKEIQKASFDVLKPSSIKYGSEDVIVAGDGTQKEYISIHRNSSSFVFPCFFSGACKSDIIYNQVCIQRAFTANYKCVRPNDTVGSRRSS